MPDRPETPSPHRRRPRYSGSHPRRFDQKYKELDPARYPQMQEHVRAQGRTPAGTHVPVLVDEVLAALRPRPGDILCDATLGYGGHAHAMLRAVGEPATLYGFDLDAAQLERTSAALRAEFGECDIRARHSNFAGIARPLGRDEIGPAGELLPGYDVILADLGVSSMQLDDPQRGFSWKHDGPLDMRMDPRLRRTAADLLATISTEKLSAALLALGDEPAHAVIADALTGARERGGLTTTRALRLAVERVAGEQAVPRVFQALRMLVNDELGSLRELLRVAPACLRAGGRIAIISFHSGEDRLVKQSFRARRETGEFHSISEEPIRPGQAERRANPRSASARLRWAMRERDRV